MTELLETVRPIFVVAGWHSGRRVEVSTKVPLDHPASTILAEFGGLIVGDGGAGKECAKASLVFEYIEPDCSINLWADLLQSRLIGVADQDYGHAELYVDGSGRYYSASVIHDAFSFVGASFTEAVERLLTGRQCQPMLRPDQANVVLYGEVFTTDDPRVYKYR